jgi:biotin transport system substrate-specific component
MILQHVSVKEMTFASLFAALTSIGAFLVIPFYPVPITCQTLFTYLSVMLLGKRIGVLSQILYLSLGLIGLPVFAAGRAGPAVLLGPTGGYLWGFVLSAYTMGYLIEKRKIKKIHHFIVIGMIGLFFINFSGALQLYLVTKLNVEAVFFAGVLPFLAGDIIKVFTASFMAYKLKLTLNHKIMM